MNAQILYADDQFVNQQELKNSVTELGLEERLSLFSNGKEVVNYFEELLR